MRRLRLFVVTALAILAYSLPLLSADEFYEYRGSDVPFYFAACEFYQLSYDALRMGEDALYWTVLREMDIEAGSPAAKAIEEAAVEAHVVLRKHLDLRNETEDRARFKQLQREFNARRVKDVGRIFQEMLEVIKLSGKDPAVVLDYVNKEIAPRVTIVSSEPNAFDAGGSSYYFTLESEKAFSIKLNESTNFDE